MQNSFRPPQLVAPNSVAILSGGLDSTTLVYDMLEHSMVPHLLSFDYGQRHAKELAFARLTARALQLPHDIIDLTGLTHLISNSALTSQLSHDGSDQDAFREIEVPDGHYAEDSMKATVVPNRNMIMLSIAAGVAVNMKAQAIGIGVHAGDHFIYPDCRPEFLQVTESAILLGNEGFGSFEDHKATDARLRSFIYAPFIRQSKTDIAYRAIELGVPIHMTWSCYKGGDKHCGRCGTCVERLEAINGASDLWSECLALSPSRKHEEPFVDQTEYEDSEFWVTAAH